MKKVNFLIIGTQKAGTTSLYEYVKQHPDIYFSDVKEVIYFVKDDLFEKGEEYYHSFFSKIQNETVIASAYVHMLPCKKSILRVKQYNPDMKFIVMLREPVSRAFSAYNYAIKNGWEHEEVSFGDSLKLESERIKKESYDLMYFENGMYYKHLSNWQEYFPKENFLIIKDTELKHDADSVLKKIFKFLLIDDSIEINTSKEFNKAGAVRSKKLQYFLLNKNSFSKKIIGSFMSRNTKVWIRSHLFKKIYQLNQVNREYGTINKELEEYLKEYFKKDLENLEKEFGVSFN